MTDLLTIGFEYRDNFYYSLIRVKEKGTDIDYQITVMNGDLEKLLYGNHIIQQRNGSLQMEAAENTDMELLKFAIAEALSKFLGIPLEVNQKSKVSTYENADS